MYIQMSSLIKKIISQLIWNKQYLVKPDIGHKNLVFLILEWKLSRFMKKIE